MNTSLECRLMCYKAKELQQQWNPQVGDFMLALGSYCGDEEKCNRNKLCKQCLVMDNEYVISGRYDFHESVGGTHWFFGGSVCVIGSGNRMNSTHCSVMTITGDSEIDSMASSKDKFLWLPRQDQLQDMFLVGLTKIYRVKRFVEWLETATYNAFTDSLEMLWLRFYMEEKFNKRWNAINNVKEWE